MERLSYFKNYVELCRELKALVSRYVEAEVYVFGSVVRGDYSPGLSDIDVAVVSDEFEDRSLKLRVYDALCDEFFDTPIEFHLLTSEQWKLYLRFIGSDYARI